MQSTSKKKERKITILEVLGLIHMKSYATGCLCHSSETDSEKRKITAPLYHSWSSCSTINGCARLKPRTSSLAGIYFIGRASSQVLSSIILKQVLYITQSYILIISINVSKFEGNSFSDLQLV